MRAATSHAARPQKHSMREVAMTDTLSLLREEHINFGKLLDLLDAELALFHQGDTPNYELMLDVMFYMTHFPDMIHHPKEELAFARLAQRDPGVARTVEELTRQHELLKESGAKLVLELEDIVNGSILSRQEVEVPGRIYVENFRAHIEREEAEMFPMAERLLRTRDWAAIDSAIERREDPIFGKTAERRYAAIRFQIDRESNFPGER
jgi:hemerythrin-like domain-containing protein